MRPRGETRFISSVNKSTRPDSSRDRARRKWKKLVGPIPEGYHIHHIDENPNNNDLSNLACLTKADHASLHHRGPEYGIPYHLRPKRQEYTKAYMKVYNKQYKLRKRLAKQTTNV